MSVRLTIDDRTNERSARMPEPSSIRGGVTKAAIQHPGSVSMHAIGATAPLARSADRGVP